MFLKAMARITRVFPNIKVQIIADALSRSIRRSC